MQRFQRRRTGTVLIGLALLAACSKGETPNADSAAPVAATPPNPLVSRAAKAMPGALTKPIDSYSGDEFHDFVQTLSYTGGHERERKCKDDLACEGANPVKKTKVLVDAVATQDSIAASNAPQYGVVYIRALNKGDNVEARYGMQPDKKLEYYMIVTADSGGGMKWRLEQLDTKSRPRRHAAAGTGAFVGCNHAWVAGAQADFKTCTSAATARDSVVKLGLMLQTGGNEPFWAACAMGCCIGQ